MLALPKGPSIAVLPFANLSGDPKEECFADGITEEIITELTRFRELFVLARNTTFQYKGQAVDVKNVGRELGVRYVLEGSVRRAGGKIRVNAQLLDASSGGHLWAETYDRELTASNVLGVQDEITEHVVAKVAEPYGAIFRAGVQETQRKRTDNLTAYECVLHARDYVQTEVSPALHLLARDCLERAIALDPDYAEAWAWLSEMYLDEYRFGYNQRPEPKPLDRALNAARRAVALDPTSAMGHLALASAHYFRRELDQFEVAAEQALALNPNNAFVLARLAVCFTGLGQLEHSKALARKAIALSPHHPSWYQFPVFMYHYREGEYAEALAVAQKWNQPEFFWNQVHLAQAYAYLGRKEEAQAAVDKLLQLYPDFPKNAWKEWRIWLKSEEIVQHEAEGLRRAGLEIPPE
jgi:TolB-like protein/Tfp pilus assembly protein PilF